MTPKHEISVTLGLNGQSADKTKTPSDAFAAKIHRAFSRGQ
jgi:hypothetical protein